MRGKATMGLGMDHHDNDHRGLAARATVPASADALQKDIFGSC